MVGLVCNTSAVMDCESLQRIVTNVKPKTRYDTMEGETYLVVPMVMLVEGVHNGSLGPLYYPKDELSLLPQVWNHKPVVVYHPKENSACMPNILTSSKIGIIMNAKFVGNKLIAEAWLREDRVRKIDERILESIQNGKAIEISTGLYTVNEMIEGEWNGEHYIGIARNYKPDHLAVLPDMVGACSTLDGAGLLRNNTHSLMANTVLFRTEGCEEPQSLFNAFGLVSNEISFDAIRQQLDSLLSGLYPKATVWALEVFKSFFIFEKDHTLYRQDYEMNGDIAKISGIPLTVQRVVSYEPVKNENRKVQQMDKKKVVDALIANTLNPWKEDDREMLMAMDENALVAVENADKAASVAITNAQKTPEPKKDTKVEKKTEPVKVDNTEPVKPVTTEQYIANAPKEIQEVLQNGMDSYQKEKDDLVVAITANKANVFTQEQLESMKIGQLRGIAALAHKEDTKKPVRNYGPQGNPDNASLDTEPLVAPVMNFDKKTA